MVKFNNVGLALGMSLKFYTSVGKGSKLKVRKFFGLRPTFVDVTGEKLGVFCVFNFQFLFRTNGKKEHLDEGNFHHSYGNYFESAILKVT